MTEYLFKDIFDKFPQFFNVQENKESRFLYDVSFGFMPRRFEATKEDEIIYDEEDDVPEMYFIMEGHVGIGYGILPNSIKRDKYTIAKRLKNECLICDHYVVNNQKSQFVYIVQKEVKAFALTRKFLVKQIFVKYPDIGNLIKADSLSNYKSTIHNPIVSHSLNYLE